MISLLLKNQFECTAYEPFASPEQENFANKNGFEIQTKLPQEATYDVITLVEVIEHLPVVQDVLPNVIKRLNSGGLLIVTTPNGVRFSQWLQFVLMRRAHPTQIKKFLRQSNTHEGHSREFTSRELAMTLEHFGLKIEINQTANLAASAGDRKVFAQKTGQPIPKFSVGDRVKSICNSVFPFWRPSLICIARKPN